MAGVAPDVRRARRRVRVALLVAPSSFESFYRDHLGLDRRAYVDTYRNDFVSTYAEALREHDVEVVVYIASNAEEGYERADDGLEVRFLRLPRAWGRLEPGIARARTPVERYALEAGEALVLLPQLRTALTADGIDVLYVQEYWTGRFDVLTRGIALPVIAGEHGGSGGLHVHVFKAQALRRAAAITVQSTAEQRRLGRYGCRAELITNGVDTDFFVPPAVENRAQTVPIVARLVDAQKRISDLITAIGCLPAGWTLEVIGSGPDEAQLRDCARRTGVEDRVRFLGWMSSREALLKRYQRCSVFALPSRWEAVTLALLEAMACGAAPVVTQLRPFLDLINPGVNGFFVAPDSPEELAATIVEAGRNRVMVGAEARRTVERRFARRITMATLASLIHHVADGSASADAHARVQPATG